MKKILAMVLTAILVLSAAAFAEGSFGYDDLEASFLVTLYGTNYGANYESSDEEGVLQIDMAMEGAPVYISTTTLEDGMVSSYELEMTIDEEKYNADAQTYTMGLYYDIVAVLVGNTAWKLTSDELVNFDQVPVIQDAIADLNELNANLALDENGMNTAQGGLVGFPTQFSIGRINVDGTDCLYFDVIILPEGSTF